MVYSDTSTNLGIIQDITFKTGVGTSQYTLADRTRSINNWYMKVVNWIIEADGRWQWDDTNQTDRPCASTDLVDGQQDYTVLNAKPSTIQDWLQIDRVEILDSNDNAIEITPIDQTEVKQALTEFQDTDAQPMYYDFRGNSVYFYPAPNYDSTKGLTVYFKRAPLVFAASDTTKKPGFASTFHEILSLGAKYDWEVAKAPEKSEQTLRDITIMEQRIKQFYSKRNKYERPKLRRSINNYK